MFEDLGKKLSDLGNKVVKKTGEVAETATLQAKILGKKKNIQDAYTALGKAFYEAHKDEMVEFADRIAGINSLLKEIEELEAEIKTIKEKAAEAAAESEEKAEESEKEADEEAEEDIFEEEDSVEEVVEEKAEEISEVVEEKAEEALEVIEEKVEEVVEE